MKRKRGFGKPYTVNNSLNNNYKRNVKPKALTWTRTGGSTAGMYIKPGNMVEKKVIDTATAQYGMNTTGTVTCLNGVANGTDFTNRIGRKININSVYVRGHVFNLNGGSFAATDPCLCRMILVYDSQPTGSLPAITDLLNASSSTEQLNMNNRDRFSVFWDKQWSLAEMTTTVAGAPTNAVVKKYKKCNYETVFDGTSNALSSIATGAIYLFTIGDYASGGSNYVFSGSIRIRFTDL